MKKRTLAASAAFAAGIFVSSFFVGADPSASVPRVYVNGERVNADVIMKNDRTYLPLRAVGEAMGAEVSYDEETDCVFVNFTEDNAVAHLVEQVSPSVVAIIANAGDVKSSSYVSGSGVIYKSNGTIITNAHVVEDTANLTVILYDGTMLPATVLFSDKETDLAIIKVNKIGLTPITFAETQPMPGQTAIAIGTPTSMTLRNTVTKGVVSGVDIMPLLEDMNYYKLLQMDTTINHGNSGGALINMRGELIGINSYGLGDYMIENTNFAIPMETVRFVIDCYEKYGKIVRPTFGLTLETSWEAQIGLPTTKGMTVRKSDNAALAVGDVICGVNGYAVSNIYDFRVAVRDTYTPGSPITVGVRTGGEDGAYKEVQISATEE